MTEKFMGKWSILPYWKVLLILWSRRVVVKREVTKRLTISPSFLSIKRNGAILTDDKAPFLPFDERDFYLNEDLLDKQVIDVNDKRLVRVNDVVMESDGELKGYRNRYRCRRDFKRA